MTLTAAELGRLVMELREKTGAGMMDCKKALEETRGNVEEALTYLRKKGVADASKKVGRVTKEGLVAFALEGRAGAMAELLCETDFVARSPEFGQLAKSLAQKAAAGQIKSPEDGAAALEPARLKFKENMIFKRLERFEPSGPALVRGYIHLDGKKGSMIELSAPSEQACASEDLDALAKELLLQIVGNPPKYLDRSAIPAAEVEKEKEIYAEQLRKEGKPEASIPKIIEGKLNKLFYQQQCLLDQVSLRDNKTSIAGMVQAAAAKVGGAVSVKRFVRFQLGE